MTTDEAVRLAGKFGYCASVNPRSTSRDWGRFEQWMNRSFAAHSPVMLSVDASGAQDEAGHWWVIYGDTGEANWWVMDPYDQDVPFECCSKAEIREFASCDDGDGYLEFDGVALSNGTGSGQISVPPSAALMEFLNEDLEHDTGWTSQEIAAALVDNHFSSVDELRSRGRARGRSAVALTKLLDSKGTVDQVVDGWDVFCSDAQRENIRSLSKVLHDVESHKAHNLTASEVDHMTREIALNLILIGTNLMDE